MIEPSKPKKKRLKDRTSEEETKKLEAAVFEVRASLPISDSIYFDDEDLDELELEAERPWQKRQRSAAADFGQELAAAVGASGGSGCPYCGKVLRNMTRHIEDVHCPVEIACQLCGKICTSRNKLRTHMAQVCNKKFLGN